MTAEAVQEGQRLAGGATCANADGILEEIARDYGVSTLEVVRNLPQAHRTVVPGELFDEVMQAVTAWDRFFHRAHVGHRARVRRSVAAGDVRPGLLQCAR